VLVVDDDPQLVRALVINLQARQYGVHGATDGTTALRLAVARQPDVVLLDLGLPDIGRWPRSMPAPTTTPPSRSAWTNFWPGCGPPYGAVATYASLPRSGTAGDPGHEPGAADHAEAPAPEGVGLSQSNKTNGCTWHAASSGSYVGSPRGNGVGVGLAVARGFVEAIRGTLHAEDTPGGGLTMVLTLAMAASHPPSPEPDLSPTAIA
jgi:hypothetical protein